VVALVAVAATAMALAQRLSQDRQYRRLLGDGEVALRRGQSYVAIEAFSGALALRPESMVAYYRRGEAYREQRQDDKAIRDLREARRLAPDAPQPLVALGVLYDLRGDHAAAAEWFSQAADRLKDADPGVLYALALARYRAGAPAAAQDPLRRALAGDGTMAEAYYLLGLVDRDAQDIEGATTALEQAVRIQPGLIAAREELADVYRARGRSIDELDQLQALAALDPEIERRVAFGLAEVRHGELDSAIATLSDATVLAPSSARAQVALGRAYLARAERTGDKAALAGAISTLKKVLDGSAPQSEGLALLGRALYVSGDYVAAARVLREATITTPVDSEAFAFLADTAERLGRPREARDALIDLDLLQGDAASSGIRPARARRIGALSISAGDPAAALAYLTRAIDGGQSDAGAFGLLARAKWQTGDATGAKLALGQALALDARNAELQRLLRTIQ
jgi:Flp pilus assembly protein TadD